MVFVRNQILQSTMVSHFLFSVFCNDSLHISWHSVKGVLTDISLNTSLIIESRDCIASPEDYTLVVSFNNTDTDLQQSVNISFNSTVVHDVGDMLMEDTVYLIIVVLVETTSNTVIDEMNTTIRTPPQPGCYIIQHYSVHRKD